MALALRWLPRAWGDRTVNKPVPAQRVNAVMDLICKENQPTQTLGIFQEDRAFNKAEACCKGNQLRGTPNKCFKLRIQCMNA